MLRPCFLYHAPIFQWFALKRNQFPVCTMTSLCRDLEERCDHDLLECAAGTAADGAFIPQKVDICTMAATPDCSAIFHQRKTAFAARLSWHGRGHPALQGAGAIPHHFSKENNSSWLACRSAVGYAGIFTVLLMLVLRLRQRVRVSNPASPAREVEHRLIEAVDRETGAVSRDPINDDALDAEASQVRNNRGVRNGGIPPTAM